MPGTYQGTGAPQFNRSDYMDIFQTGGGEALTRAIRERFPNPDVRDREFQRMNKYTWVIFWNSETGEGEVVARRNEDD